MGRRKSIAAEIATRRVARKRCHRCGVSATPCNLWQTTRDQPDRRVVGSCGCAACRIVALRSGSRIVARSAPSGALKKN